PAVDWVIDAAANPSVLAGVDGISSSRQVVEHNLTSTVNLLEYARKHGAGFLLLSTSRLYSISELSGLPLITNGQRFQLRSDVTLPDGVCSSGINERFSTAAPISLYGATKLASEVLALEYAETFGVPVWVNRCGVIAGAGQFGRADQGIVAFWVNSYLRRKSMRYIGFNGAGHQVRDAVHPRDVAALVTKQLDAREADGRPRVVNVGGGDANSFSLAELTAWCGERFGFKHAIESEPNPRPLDLPWIIMDSALAQKTWGWAPTTSLRDIFEEVATHAEKHPDWLDLSSPF
ncbi:MAG: NAD-dependent epimerase/dehydratase family protein, partial [Chthoniobacterales bacterium]